MKSNKAVFHWSGGKDSSIALHELLKGNDFQISTLLTSISEYHDRVSMHGVRRELIESQAKSIGMPLTFLNLPDMPDMNVYETLMEHKMSELSLQEITHAVFGDIFLEDLKRYRENQMEKAGLQTHFPIWKQDTNRLIRKFLDDGFKAVVACVKADVLDQSFAGRLLDEQFLEDLPETVDPCGENGEFHTFVFDGPIFSYPVPFTFGDVIYREYDKPSTNNHSVDKDAAFDPQNHPKAGFWFCDLEPVQPS